MKIVVFGDIHGRPWWKDIIEKENPTKVIFLGDYVSTHDNYTGQEQFDNLVDIMDYKEEMGDNCIMLRGNHDLQHLGYSWAECSGWFGDAAHYMSSSNFKPEFLAKTKWVHVEEIGEEKYLFSHAGVSKKWLEYSNINNIENINETEPSERFGFCPSSYFDMYGTSPTQPCTWIRPQTLVKVTVDDYNQVVGHTPVREHIQSVKMDNGKDLWLCDNMSEKEYLVIEDNKINVKKL